MKQKRITAFLLAVAITFSLLPTFTLTASAATTKKPIAIGKSVLSGYSASYCYIWYGTYGGNPIKWRILTMNGNDGTYKDKDDNAVFSQNAMFALSEYGLKKMAYDADGEKNTNQNRVSDWRYSDIWNWCNNTSDTSSFIYGSFTADEKSIF